MPLSDGFFLTDPLFGEIRFAIVAVLQCGLSSQSNNSKCNGTVTGTGSAVLETMGSITRRYGNHNGSFFAALKLRSLVPFCCMLSAFFVCRREIARARWDSPPAKCRCVWLRAIAKRNTPESSNVGSPALET